MKFIKKKKEINLDKKEDLLSSICDRFKDCSDFLCQKISFLRAWHGVVGRSRRVSR